MMQWNNNAMRYKDDAIMVMQWNDDAMRFKDDALE
jgi:hypothetical protein